MQKILNFINYTKKEIDKCLKGHLSISNKPYKILIEAATYSVLSECKRLRPLLVIATAKSAGHENDNVMPLAIALEFIHTYSLIHDDLPCMDDDSFRRGKKTLHLAFSEDIAILTGDFLLTLAFEIISKAKNISDEKKIKLISLLAKYSGGNELIAGQILDINFENKKISFEELKLMHLKKTASLFICAFEFGAIISDTSDKDRQILKEFGEKFGLIFQFVDDILDFSENSSDAIKNKATAISILGIKNAKN